MILTRRYESFIEKFWKFLEILWIDDIFYIYILGDQQRQSGNCELSRWVVWALYDTIAKNGRVAGKQWKYRSGHHRCGFECRVRNFQMILESSIRNVQEANWILFLSRLVHTFEVKAVPAVIAFRNGVVVDKFIGLVDGNMIEDLINNLGRKNRKV